MRDLLVRTQAATKLRTSVVAMTEAEFHNYCTQLIKYHYPRLAVHNYLAYSNLVYRSEETPGENFDPYEWWFTVVIGPHSCSRDLGDLRKALHSWYQSHQDYGRQNGVHIALGDEWNNPFSKSTSHSSPNAMWTWKTGYSIISYSILGILSQLDTVTTKL